MLLGLLDLSAVFDCVDRDVLLPRLHVRCGISGTAHDWISSFLSGCSQWVLYRGHLLAEWQLLFGVLQGSVLGPILFLLDTAELFDVTAECGFTGNMYTDDTQVYLSTPASDHVTAIAHLENCTQWIRDWMADNHLKLNKEKTQIIWLGTHQQLNKLSTHALTHPNATVQFSAAVKTLALY